MTESALIQNVEGPASGNITTAALSPIKLPPCNVVVFYSYEVKKRKCYDFMAALTVRAKAHTAAPIWATSWRSLKKRRQIRMLCQEKTRVVLPFNESYSTN